jgi:hypothetical protein
MALNAKKVQKEIFVTFRGSPFIREETGIVGRSWNDFK